jgi:hypothetical protein
LRSPSNGYKPGKFNAYPAYEASLTW